MKIDEVIGKILEYHPQFPADYDGCDGYKSGDPDAECTGVVCALGFGVNLPVLIIPVGIIYLCEILSVVIQVTYFKLTHGKRVFKMAPIHHHFEMCGWKEKKICVVFSAVNAVGCIVGVILLYFGIVK